jgi:hypothetical protein
MDECIWFNTSVSIADKEVFGISPRDDIRTPVRTPTATGNVDAKRRGAFEYEAIVIDEATSKRKLPAYATGSYIYLPISEPDVLSEDINPKLETNS